MAQPVPLRAGVLPGVLYGTTKEFLEVFGLNTLKDLPKVEELKNPDRG